MVSVDVFFLMLTFQGLVGVSEVEEEEGFGEEGVGFREGVGLWVGVGEVGVGGSGK